MKIVLYGRVRTAFYDCPTCPHYHGEAVCQCVRREDSAKWWSRWFWLRLDRLAWRILNRRWP